MEPTFWQRLAQVLAPWACAGCRRTLHTANDSGFCPSCWLAIPRLGTEVCQQCGLGLPWGGARCFDCEGTQWPLRIRAASRFAGVVIPALHRFKYLNRPSLADPLAALLATAWFQHPLLQEAEALVPVPLSQNAYRHRGYNQSLCLAAALSPLLARPVLSGGLLRTRRTLSQTRLTREARRINVAGAFEADSGTVRGQHLLLIDDVCTTGATLIECARTLRMAGAATVDALVISRDDPPRGPLS